MIADLQLYIIIEASDRMAITKAIIGKAGYEGTLKGRGKSGSFFLSRSIAIIEMIYSVNAPNTEMVMISAVLFVNNARIPIAIFISNAFAGVRNRRWIWPSKAGAYPTLPNSKLARPAASMMP